MSRNESTGLSDSKRVIEIPTVIREFRETDAEDWMKFVRGHPSSTFYHTLLWRDFIVEVFRHRPVYLLAERAGEICGVLPMFLIRLPGIGSKLISLPYDIGSGGSLSIDASSEYSLVEQAISRAGELKVDYLELRCGLERPALDPLGLEISRPVLISEITLDSEAAAWARIRKNHRNAIHKAERQGLTVREAENLADFQSFYRIYLEAFRNFGTPPYGWGYFQEVWRRLFLSGVARMLLAYAGQECVGGLLFYYFGRSMLAKFVTCLPEAKSMNVSAALYWRAIQLGLSLGCLSLNMGTSSREQKGLLVFKERWGAVTRPAVFYGLPVRGRIPSIERYYSETGMARSIWRRLPIGLTRIGGAILNRWFC